MSFDESKIGKPTRLNNRCGETSSRVRTADTFSPDAKCAKCGHVVVATSYGADNKLIRTCKRCGFFWLELPLDYRPGRIDLFLDGEVVLKDATDAELKIWNEYSHCSHDKLRRLAGILNERRNLSACKLEGD